MQTKTITLFFIAGEASGDKHTADLIRELKQRAPDIRYCGLGGTHMAAEGCEIFYDLTRLAVVGLIEVLKKLHRFKKIFNDALKKVKELRPQAVILTDFPGFNLRFAKAVKALGIPVIYYVSPQVWAWKRKRIYSIPKIVDKMLVILPFEKDLYSHSSMAVDFVGHPLVHQVVPSNSREALRSEFGIPQDSTVILLFPGSRKAEVRRILPILHETASLLHKQIAQAYFVIAKSPSIPAAYFNRSLGKKDIPFTVIEGRPYDAFTLADFGLIKSGTSTLEASIAGLPYVLIYVAHPITYWVGRLLVKIDFLGLANIIAGRRVIPEFIQHEAKPHKIAAAVTELLRNKEQLTEMKAALTEVRHSLGTENAAVNAAEAVLEFIGRKA